MLIACLEKLLNLQKISVFLHRNFLIMVKHISSTQNPSIKKLLQLQEKSRTRKKEQLFVVEGFRELSLAIKGGFEIESVYINLNVISEQTVTELVGPNCNCYSVSEAVYEKIAYRGSTEGVVACVKFRSLTINDLKFKTAHPLILVAEAPEKPGNIGALLRTADAANLDAVIIANPKTDLYNPNIIRSSVGCVFTNQIAVGTTQEIIQYLNQKHIAIYAATLQNKNPYHLEDYTKAAALVVGTEATGLSQAWRTAAFKNIIIPMQGAIDSMNVSVATGILIFEAKRQRNFK